MVREAFTGVVIGREWLRQMIGAFGEASQFDQTAEECAELIVAVNKVRRSGCSPESLQQLAGEAADVLLMVAQVFEILRSAGIEPDSYVEHKMQRAEMYRIAMGKVKP